MNTPTSTLTPNGTIHPTAIIDPSSHISANVSIGPYTIIGPNCTIGEGTQLGTHVVIERNTRLGKNCKVSPGAVLGGEPQDLGFKGEATYVQIGNDVHIREYVTIHRPTGDGLTTIGDGCFIMAYCHIAHNCTLGKKVILANNTQMAGHVEVGDGTFISGSNVIHQNVKIGRFVIMAGFSGTRQDLPPFSMCSGIPATVTGINKIGLRRNGFSQAERTSIRKAFSLLWFSDLNTTDAIAKIESELEESPHLTELIEFVTNSKRGIRHPGNAHKHIKSDTNE